MTKRFGIMVVGIVTLLLLAGCQSATQQKEQPPGTTQSVSLAPEETFANNCSSCHGGSLEGAVGPNLQKIGSKLKKEEIASIIQNGRNSMPGQPQVSAEARDKLAEWLAQKK